MREKFITVGVLRNWNRLPREVVNVPSLEMWKVKLDRALINLVFWQVPLSTAKGLKIDHLYGPFQSKLFYDNIILWCAKHVISAAWGYLLGSFVLDHWRLYPGLGNKSVVLNMPQKSNIFPHSAKRNIFPH